MRGPLVSIITPVLNRVETMGANLASVTRQTYRSIEHIVVDGGSTDGTWNSFASIGRRIPSHWVSEPDWHVRSDQQRIAISRGEVLAYLNSDDLYLPWSVDVAVRAIKLAGVRADLRGLGQFFVSGGTGS
jgi:glycosyltransferase involved in cell wall biosynthesis